MKRNFTSVVWALCFGTAALQATMASGQTAKDFVRMDQTFDQYADIS